MRVYKKPHESSKYRGFYQSPIPDILINKQGLIRNSKTGKILPTPMSGEYPGIFKTHVHRLMARTFLKCPGPENEYQVNHIDGDKLNPRLENLEWATRSQNALHAYLTGLRPDNKAVVVKDLETDSVHEFYSLSEAARFMNINPSSLCLYLKKDKAAPLFYKWTACYKGQAMPDFNRSDLYKPQIGNPFPFIALCKKTGNYIMFNGIVPLREYLKQPVLTLVAKLIQNEVNFDSIKIINPLEYPGKFKDLIKIGFKTGKKVAPKPPVPIDVLDLKTGTTSSWKSSEEFSKHLGVKKNTMQKAMLVNDGKFMNYKITYRR